MEVATVEPGDEHGPRAPRKRDYAPENSAGRAFRGGMLEGEVMWTPQKVVHFSRSASWRR